MEMILKTSKMSDDDWEKYFHEVNISQLKSMKLHRPDLYAIVKSLDGNEYKRFYFSDDNWHGVEYLWRSFWLNAGKTGECHERGRWQEFKLSDKTLKTKARANDGCI